MKQNYDSLNEWHQGNIIPGTMDTPGPLVSRVPLDPPGSPSPLTLLVALHPYSGPVGRPVLIYILNNLIFTILNSFCQTLYTFQNEK